MHNTTQQNQAPVSAEDMADSLINDGLECYCVAGRWYIFWIPWKNKVIELGNTERTKRVLGLPNAKAVWTVVDQCLPDRLPLQVPDRIAKRYPMPQAAAGERFPKDKDIMKWAKKVLRAMNKTERK